MNDFWQTYGVWLFWGVMIFFMFRMHRSGGGCCGASGNKNVDEKAAPNESEHSQTC